MEQIVTDNFVAAPYLPEDMIRIILVRLPVKSLVRFRSVCKDWKNLFKTESFIAEHLDHSTTTKQGHLIWDCGMAGSDLRLINPVDDDMQAVKFLKQPSIDVPVNSGRFLYPSNGLLCVIFFHSESILLWNPAIRESRQVRITVNHFPRESYRIGFGFSPILNDYKILRICFSLTHHQYAKSVHRVEIYSLSEGSWREVDDFGNLNDEAKEISDHSITFNGAIFWFCLKNYIGDSGSDDDDDDNCLILSFDIATEVFAFLEVPTSVFRSTRYRKLTVYENKLAILCERACRKLKSSSIDLWVMMEGLSWTKLYNVTVPFPRSIPPIVIWQDKIISGVTNYGSESDDDDDEDEDEDDDEEIILVNLKSNEVKTSGMRKCCFDDWVFNYVESLVPVCDNSV